MWISADLTTFQQLNTNINAFYYNLKRNAVKTIKNSEQWAIKSEQIPLKKKL